MFYNGVWSAGTVKVLNFYKNVTKTLSHANYISSGQLIIDRLAGYIEPRGRPYVGPRAVGWTTLIYNDKTLSKTDTKFNPEGVGLSESSL